MKKNKISINFQYSTECTVCLIPSPFNKPGLLTQKHHNVWYRLMVISGAALQLEGNRTDSFTLKGGLDKAKTLANLQQGESEML